MMFRNCGFSRNEFGVGGIEVAVPIARDSVGGEVRSNERRYEDGCVEFLNMYCNFVSIESGCEPGEQRECLLHADSSQALTDIDGKRERTEMLEHMFFE